MDSKNTTTSNISPENRIRILWTSDVHGTVYPHSYADNATSVDLGYARIATLVRELRDRNTVVIDGGDVIEGSALTSFHQRFRADKPSPATLALADVGYDYICLGNHDFNFGQDCLDLHIQHSGAQNLSANVSRAGEPLAPDYVIREISGAKVAFVGVSTQYIPNWEPPAHVEGMAFENALESVSRRVKEIREHDLAHIVVVCYHGGFERDPITGEPIGEDTGENLGYRMLTQVPGIDVLLTGHQHRVYCDCVDGVDGGKVAIVQPGHKGAYLACVDIDAATGQALPSLIEVKAEPAQDVMDHFTEEEAACQLWLDEPLGESVVDLEIRDSFAAKYDKHQLVTFLNLVQSEAIDAQLSATALFPGATGFTNPITMRDLVSTYIFSNTLVLKEVTGAVLKEFLEKSVEFFALEDGRVVVSPDYADPPQDFNYDMVDGIEYTVDVSRPIGERIVSMTCKGSPVQPDDVFTLAVNNYRGMGGGGFPMIAQAPTLRENLTDMVELIANYISRHDGIDFGEVHNIRVLP